MYIKTNASFVSVEEVRLVIGQSSI